MAQKTFNLQAVVSVVDNATKEFATISKQFEEQGKRMQQVGKSLSLFVTAPVLGMGASFIKAASDAEESRNRFNQVFGDLKGEAEDFSRTLSDAVGRNTVSVQDGMAAFQSFTVGLGFSREESLQMSEALTTLSLDFASFNNLSDGEAQQRFISAMSGSGEVLDMFGINIKDAAIQQELYAMGINKSTAKASEQEKALARLNIIMKTMTVQGSVGDAIRTSDSFANSLKRTMDNILTLRQNIGEKLLPVMQQFLAWVNNVLDGISKMDDGTVRLILTVGTFAALLGPTAFAIGTVTKALAVLRAALIAGRLATIAFLGPIGIVVAIAGTLAAVFAGSVMSSLDGTTKSVEDLNAEAEKFLPTLGGITADGGAAAGAMDQMKKQAENLAKTMEDLKKRTLDVIKDVFQTEKDYKKEVAEAIIEQEKKVADIKRELAEATRNEESKEDAKRIRELEQSLEREKEALRGAKDLKKQFSAEVAEARRRDSLTDFERTLEDLENRRQLEQQAHLEELQRIKEERDEAIKKDQEVKASFIAAMNSIQEKLTETADHAKLQFKVITDEAKAAAQTVKSAFDDIGDFGGGSFKTSTPAYLPRRAQGGPVSPYQSYIVGEKRPEVFTPSTFGTIGQVGGGGVYVTITDNTFLDDRAAVKIGNDLARVLKRNRLMTV